MSNPDPETTEELSDSEDDEEPDKENNRKSYVIDLNKIEDRLPTNWWNKLDPFTFGFWTKLPLLSYCRVKEYDILIQKQKREEERFITVQYYQIINGKAEIMGMDNNRVKTFLSTTLLQFIVKHKQLPFSCRYAKEFKNGNIQIDFTPTKWDKYAIHIEAKEAKRRFEIEDLMELTHDLKAMENNPAIKRKKSTETRGIKQLTREEYKKKMQKLDETEFMADLLKPDGDTPTKAVDPAIEKERKIQELLAKLDADDTPIKPPEPKPPLKTVDTKELVAFIKSMDKGSGVNKMEIMSKFVLDQESFIKLAQELVSKMVIYKVKPSFYAVFEMFEG